MLIFLGLIALNALLYFAAANKRVRRNAIKSQWMMRNQWVQLTESEKEEYEGLSMAALLIPAILLSCLILAMLILKIIEIIGG